MTSQFQQLTIQYTSATSHSVASPRAASQFSSSHLRVRRVRSIVLQSVALEQHLNSRPRSFKTRSTVLIMDRNTQKEMPPQFQVVKVFLQRGYLCLHRLAKPAAFTCNRCSLEKTSKLVAFAKDKWDEPVCNGCYGYLLAASEVNDCARGTQGNSVGVTACTHSRRSLKSRRVRKSARRDRKSN